MLDVINEISSIPLLQGFTPRVASPSPHGLVGIVGRNTISIAIDNFGVFDDGGIDKYVTFILTV